MVDVEIVGASDLQDGTMMQLQVGPDKKNDLVLVTRY